MDPHQLKTVDPRAVRKVSLSDRDRENILEILSAAPTMSGPSAHEDKVFKTSARHSMDLGVSRRSDPLQDRLDAIRRRLWILNATLECLPAKFELACALWPTRPA
jgi:hypothetical protein